MLKMGRALLVVVALVLLVLSMPTGLSPPPRPQPGPDDPQLGIALTVDYATASIRHPDGSFTDLGRVDGSVKYKEMMQRFRWRESERDE